MTRTYTSAPAGGYSMPAILTPDTETYLAEVHRPATGIVSEMEAQADAEGIPIASRSVARLQAILARATDADRALEFGTAIGYSTLQVARTGTRVVTLEVDPDRIADASAYLERAGVADRVDIVQGPALETVEDLTGPFDLVFIDARKEEYEAYLERALPMVPVGGLVVADNLLWQGFVPADDADVPEDWEASTRAIRAFNETFLDHDRLEAVLSPQGDGTGIALKTA